MDMTPLRGNTAAKYYILTFIDDFTKYTETYTISDQSAETCARSVQLKLLRGTAGFKNDYRTRTGITVNFLSRDMQNTRNCNMPASCITLVQLLIPKYRSGTVEFTQTLSQAVFAPAIRNAEGATLITRQE